MKKRKYKKIKLLIQKLEEELKELKELKELTEPIRQEKLLDELIFFEKNEEEILKEKAQLWINNMMGGEKRFWHYALKAHTLMDKARREGNWEKGEIITVMVAGLTDLDFENEDELEDQISSIADILGLQYNNETSMIEIDKFLRAIDQGLGSMNPLPGRFEFNYDHNTMELGLTYQEEA